MSKFKVTFNDCDLTEFLQITSLERGIGPKKTLDTQKIGVSKGMHVKRVIADEKKIRMGFRLRYDLVEKRRKLAGILNVFEPKKLMFSDEEEVYYLAIPEGDISLDEKNFIGDGVIYWYIADGVAHSVNEKVAEFENGVKKVEIVNEGTETTYPTFQIDMKSDNGFVGIINNDGRIIQVGDPDEIDGFDYEKSEYGIIDYCGINFFEPNYHSHGWKTNEGTVLEINGIKCDQTGEFEYGEYKVNYHQWAGKTFYNFHPRGYGEGDSWHGASMTRAFTPDSEGGDTAQNWSFEFQQHLITGKVAQAGMQQWLVNSPDGENVAGYVFYKNSTSINDLIVCYVINGKIVHQFSTYAGIEGRWCGWSWGQWRIDKFGNKFVFTTPNGVWNFEDSDAENIPAKYVTFYAAQYRDIDPCTINFFKGCKFEKHNVKKWQDIPNKFGDLDSLIIDNYSGKISVNGIERGNLGSLGNDYFELSRGKNEITFTWSEWVETPPDIKIKYREMWV